MTKTDFIQHVVIRNCPPPDQADDCIGYAQLLWDKLAKRGYGETQKTENTHQSPFVKGASEAGGLVKAATPLVGFINPSQTKTKDEQRYRLLSEINGLKVLMQDKKKTPEAMAVLEKQLVVLENKLREL